MFEDSGDFAQTYFNVLFYFEASKKDKIEIDMTNLSEYIFHFLSKGDLQPERPNKKPTQSDESVRNRFVNGNSLFALRNPYH